jgi:hypothetical protein
MKLKEFIMWVFRRLHEFNHPEQTEEQSRHAEEKLDREIEDSFPASDPPGHRSKSEEDRNQHFPS